MNIRFHELANWYPDFEMDRWGKKTQLVDLIKQTKDDIHVFICNPSGRSGQQLKLIKKYFDILYESPVCHNFRYKFDKYGKRNNTYVCKVKPEWH